MSEFRAITISPDGTVNDHHWEVNDKALLPVLQQAVGGLVDVVTLAEDLDLWVNDCGLYTEEINPVAGGLVAILGGPRFQPYWFGTVVFTGGADQDGNIQPLSPVRAERILKLAKAVCNA